MVGRAEWGLRQSDARCLEEEENEEWEYRPECDEVGERFKSETRFSRALRALPFSASPGAF